MVQKMIRSLIVVAAAAALFPAIADGWAGASGTSESVCPFSGSGTVDAPPATQERVATGRCPFSERADVDDGCPFGGSKDDRAARGCPFTENDRRADDRVPSDDSSDAEPTAGCPFLSGGDASDAPVDPMRERNTA